MNSLDKQARQELVENLRKVYLKGSGIRGAGTKAGASKNAYIQFLKEYKGVKKPHMAYNDHKAKYKMRGGAGTKQGASKNNYIVYQKKYKGVKPKPKYNKNIDYSATTATKAKPMKKSTSGKKALPKKLMMYNKCLKRYRRDNPNVPYREAQKFVKANIDYNTGECRAVERRVREDFNKGVAERMRIKEEEKTREMEEDVDKTQREYDQMLEDMEREQRIQARADEMLGNALNDYGGLLMDYGGALDDYGGALDDYGGGLRDYFNQGHLGF
jgi:hypothetical protein